MHEHLLFYLAGIIVLGVAAQWLAWRIGLPSILLLLVIGIIAGPVTGWLNPDALFGDLLPPVVSLAVALILYEGGLTLKVAELRKVGGVVRNLVTAGALITWIVSALAANLILGLGVPLSVLLGAMLVVTGPTVIAPLLRSIRPTGAVGPALKWEGIVIDPIGALLAVLVFEVIQIGATGEATMHVAVALLKTIVFGGGLGLAAAAILTLVLARHWIADYLESAASLMLVVATFAVADRLQSESGLLAVTVMGFALANQKRVDIENIVEFKENLRVLLISSLFIVLAARVDLTDLATVAPRGLAFVAVLILIARPLSAYVSTLRSPLSRGERVVLGWMAPRGIVAAAMASVFAMRLEASGHAGAAELLPITFITIIATVAVYGLTAPIVARRLGVSEANPQGILFAGAAPWVREVALVLKREGFSVLLVDSNRQHTSSARMAGLMTHTGSILSEHALDELELGGIGRVLAVTPNDWVNMLTVHRFHRVFGRVNCYQLPPQATVAKKKGHAHLHGRWLFGAEIGHEELARRVRGGFTVKATGLSDEFDYEALLARSGDGALPLFLIRKNRRLHILGPESDVMPAAGDTVIALVRKEA